MDEFKKQRKEDVKYEEVGINLEDASYSWGFKVAEKQEEEKKDEKKSKDKDDMALKTEEDKSKTLQNIDLKLGCKDLIVVAGKIGSGKTSLLFSIMDETIKRGGKQDIRGNIAYVEQDPFIFSGTIEDNIIFGLKYDQAKFDNAIAASQLKADMLNFSNGSKTIIGERGVNVSGGQKARISLARAVYQDADIYLLDDPLSAVDPEVAHKIFKHCI